MDLLVPNTDLFYRFLEAKILEARIFEMLASKQYIFCLSCESVFENSFLIGFIGTCILFSICSDGVRLRLRLWRPAKKTFRAHLVEGIISWNDF